jgi:hypothetical protein
MKGPRFNRKKCFSIKSQTPRRKQVRPVYELTENDSDGACLEDALFALSAMEPERATRTFAEALAQQTAFLVIEKDFPNGVEPSLSLSAEQIDHIPAEFENRLPNVCVNGNNAWLVDPRIGNAELLFARKQMRPRYG